MREDGVAFPDRHPSEPTVDEDEILDTGSQAGLLGRIPAWLWAGLALAVLVASVAVALHQSAHSTGSSAQTRKTSAPIRPADRAGAARAAITPVSARVDALDRLAYLADFGHRLQNNLRGAGVTPTCPPIPIGDDPTARVAAVLRRHLHSIALRDSSVTINADATLCGLDVRARGATSAHVIVEIVAPPHGADVGMRAQRHSGDRVLRAVARAIDGWQITVGWVGPTARAPSVPTLAAIARDRHLRW